MAPFKPLLIALRVINLVLAIYAEFAVTSILIESNGNKIFLDSSLLARVGLASLAVIWTAVTFCWSTCFNGARVLAVPGMIGDIVAVIVYASVAILSRGAGAMNCSRLGGTLYIWSDSLGAWIDSEGAALSPASVVRYFDEGFVKRECSFGKSLFATSIAICALLAASAALQYFLVRETRKGGRNSGSKIDVEMFGSNDMFSRNTTRMNGYDAVRQKPA